MQEQRTATLKAIFSEVLADLAFMFDDEEPAADPSPAEPWLETTIGYHGPSSGSLRLECPSGFSRLLAANLLGVDPEDEDAETKADDAVKEFINIVCGQLVTAVHGTQDVFNLSIPEIRELPETPDFSVEDEDHACTISVEGFRVRLSYTPTPDSAGES